MSARRARIPEYPSYEVDEFGNIYREGRMLKAIVDPLGYKRVSLSRDNRARQFGIHRLVALAFFGPPPAGRSEAAHNDGNPGNNAVGNIRWASPQENQRDRRRHGTYLWGSRVHSAKLTENEALSARKLFAQGERVSDIARRFGVNHSTMSSLLSGKTWRHIGKDIAAVDALIDREGA